MARIDPLVRDFLAQRRIAVVGVSDQRETGCNLAYRKFKAAGYTVSAVSPRLSVFEGDPCYPDLKSIPEKPQAVFVLTNPRVAEHVMQQCVELDIPRVWLHCMLGTKPGLGAGTTSVSPAAVELGRAHGLTIIPGSCPNQFLQPDFGHAMMRGLWRAFGFLNLN